MRVRLQTLSFLLLLLVSSSAHAAQWTVEIFDFYFTPTNLTVGAGDTVTWINRVTRAHDTTHYDPNDPEVFLWASDLLSKDQSFSFTFTNVGAYPYVCAVHYAQHLEQTGLVMVTQINLPPSVSITNPGNGATFTAPASFTLGASAADNDGAVVSVEFFINETSAGVSQGLPFSVNVNALAAGNYSITAAATDNQGAISTSAVVTISVQEAPMKFPLNVSIQPPNSGNVTASPSQPIDGYDGGSVVTLTASASNGFVFSGWSGAITTAENPTSITMDAAKNVTANFSVSSNATHVLTLAANPVNSGVINVSPAPNGASGTYVHGTTVTLTAVPTNGFLFTNFSGGVSATANPVTILLDTDLAVTANFVTNTSPTYTLTLIAIPTFGGAIEVSGPPTAPDGSYYEG
ncbi:MAG TPA: Ig-like domain-containing protein, partial [Candidatus Limnocylindria bacterium]|nr:Ig-like domain-containing protein [Candidatus Limnocylindria bacterium]